MLRRLHVSSPVRIVFLGGLGEIGRNCFCLEVDDRILVVDCGIMFPESDMPGIDLVLPDFTYLRENADRVEAAFLTHAHEDHAGGLAFLLRDISFPIYGSPLSLGLARNRIEEAGMLGRTELIPVHDGERRMIGPFDCEFIPVTHSVPQPSPPRTTRLPARSCTAATSSSTPRRSTAARPTSRSWADRQALGRREAPALRLHQCVPARVHAVGVDGGRHVASVFRDYPDQRLIVASFASHLHRVRQVADAAVTAGRKIVFLGRSMVNNVALGREMGMLDVPVSSVIDIDEVPKYAPGEVCIICTGSQGEPMSALR